MTVVSRTQTMVIEVPTFSFFIKCCAYKRMKESPYVVVPLHHRPDLIQQCCDLLNSEWSRSDAARLVSLQKSCDDFPTCLVLMNSDIVLGHCKLSLVPTVDNGCVIESVLIDQNFRSQGLGSYLLKEAEKYVFNRGIESVYLVTKGQEEFYAKNGYTICEPIDLFNYTEFIPDSLARVLITFKSDKNYNCPTAPPPPPMPVKINNEPSQLSYFNSRTFMMKDLKNC